jgi:hypothetical protein
MVAAAISQTYVLEMSYSRDGNVFDRKLRIF